MAGLGVGGVVASVGGDEKQGRRRVVIDPSLEEEKESDVKVMVGTMPALGKVTNIWLTGEAEVDDACNMIEQVIEASKETHSVLAEALVEGAGERGIAAA